MPTALVVSRYFPPLGPAGGSIRLVKLLKHTADLGWDFIVLTQDVERTVVLEQTLSSFLLDEIPDGVRVHRVADPFAMHAVGSRTGLAAWTGSIIKTLMGESSLAWGLMVFLRGLGERASSSTDIVLAETPPFTNALIALLFSWIWYKPLLLDLKDDWVGSEAFVRKGILRRWLETRLEEIIVRKASAVITVTPESHRLYSDRYASLKSSNKFHFVPNGCDIEEYSRLNVREKSIASSRFLILSAAWGFRKDYRDITPFLLALHQIFQRRAEVRDQVDVVLLGDSLSAEYDALLAQLLLDKVIQRLGAVRRDELIEWLWKADLLLLIQPVQNRTSISGTLYEYWATGKAPILLIAEEGASSALVTKNDIGRHYCFEQVAEIAGYIETAFDAYQRGQPMWIERAGIGQYDRKELAKRVEEIWRSVLLPNRATHDSSRAVG